MSTDVARTTYRFSPFEQLRHGRQVVMLEAQALVNIARRLDEQFCRTADLLYHCRGRTIVTGMGKAGLIGQKIVATLASTGTPAHFLHPAEAVHGDLGRVQADDVVLVLSQSGETEEVLRLLPSLVELGVPVVALTARAESTLGQRATLVIDLGPIEEACPLQLAPTTSTTAMLAAGDALAMVVSRMRGFDRGDFARFHPAGSLGRKLSKVEQHLRPLEQCRVASQDRTVREVFVNLQTPGRRTGAIMLVDGEGKLAGVFTDSDLARLFERRRDPALDRPIREVMTARPTTVARGAMMSEAVAILAQRKISELPVVDDQGRPVGLIDVTDVVGMLPREVSSSETGQAAPGTAGAPRAESRPYRVFREPEGSKES